MITKEEALARAERYLAENGGGRVSHVERYSTMTGRKPTLYWVDTVTSLEQTWVAYVAWDRPLAGLQASRIVLVSEVDGAVEGLPSTSGDPFVVLRTGRLVLCFHQVEVADLVDDASL